MLLAGGGDIPFQEFLDKIGPAYRASRTYIFLNHREKTGKLLMSQAAEWCAEGIHPEIDNPALQNLSYNEFFPRWCESLSRGEIIKGRVTEFPAEEREILDPQEIRAILILPIELDREFLGFIGFDNCVSEWEWKPAEITYLRMAAAALAQAIKRRRSEEERLSLERQAQHGQKLESLGVLAGGIAHDFNNLLTGVMGNISLARMLLEQNDTAGLLRTLDDTDQAVIRATKLTSQLLTFARGGAPVRTTFDCRAMIEETVIFALRGSNVRAEFEIPDDLLPLSADEGQLNQVFSNLTINARQAMPEGGTFWIGCENILIADEDTVPGERGRYLRVTLRDEGCGIPRNLIPRIFDPFFSTKDNGRGLGLSTCHSVIKRHGGWIEVESEPGQGTTFTVYLPATESESSVEQSPSGKVLPGRGKILVMDDEDNVRHVTSKILKRLGYTPAPTAAVSAFPSV